MRDLNAHECPLIDKNTFFYLSQLYRTVDGYGNEPYIVFFVMVATYILLESESPTSGHSKLVSKILFPYRNIFPPNDTVNEINK